MAGPTPRSYNTSEIKSRLLNVATPNTYMVKFTPPSEVQSLMAERGVNYSSNGETFELACLGISTPDTSFLTHSVQADYHGVTQEIPYRRGYSNEIELRFLVDNNYDILEFFESWVDWMSGVGTRGTTNDFNYGSMNYRASYYNDYITDLYLTKFEKDVSIDSRIINSRQSKKAIEYRMIQAYPKAINSMELAYGPASGPLELSVTFGYTRYTQKRISV